METIRCKIIEEKLIFYIENELDANEFALVREHLYTCKNCNFLFKQLEASLNAIKEEKLADTNAFFVTRVMGKLENQSIRPVIFNWLPKPRFIVQFSIYILLIFFALIAGRYLGSDITSNDQTVVNNTADTSDYQLFANSYNYQYNQNTYLVEDSNNEK